MEDIAVFHGTPSALFHANISLEVTSHAPRHRPGRYILCVRIVATNSSIPTAPVVLAQGRQSHRFGCHDLLGVY